MLDAPSTFAALPRHAFAAEELGWYFCFSAAASGLRGQGYEWRPHAARTTGDLTTDGRLAAYARARRVWQRLGALPRATREVLVLGCGEPGGCPPVVLRAFGAVAQFVWRDPETRAAWKQATPRREFTLWLASRPRALDGLVSGHEARLAEALGAYAATSGAGALPRATRRPPHRPRVPPVLPSPGRHHAR